MATEILTEYYENRIGRGLNDNELQIVLEATQVINQAYEDGRSGNQFYAKEFEAAAIKNADEHTKQFIKALLIWCDAAWLSGMKQRTAS